MVGVPQTTTQHPVGRERFVQTRLHSKSVVVPAQPQSLLDPAKISSRAIMSIRGVLNGMDNEGTELIEE
jgi:hypothetical protein